MTKESKAQRLWQDLREAQTGAQVLDVMMKDFDTQQQAAEWSNVAKSRITELKTQGEISERRKTAIFGAILKKRMRCH